MASFPGTSSSSGGGGGGKQPPIKRIKVEIDLPPDSNNSSDPESSLDSPASNQAGAVSSATRVQTEHLKCPVCHEYPRKEVYQCDEGHIICNECIAKVPRCPVCRVIYPKKKIRNRVAEADLDEMGYNCSFRDHGCLTTNIPRNRRTAHEIQCGHNPTKPGLKFCSLFEATAACQFRVDPDFIMQDNEHRKDVIQHLTQLPHNLLFQKVKIWEKKSFQCLLVPASSCPPFQPLVIFEVDDAAGKTVGYYVLIRRASTTKNLSFMVVGFNSASEDLNSGSPTGVLFAIKAKVDLDKRAKDGKGCVPNLTWTMKLTDLNEWKEMMMIPSADRPPSSFSLPLAFLSDYYKKQDDSFEMIIMFGPL